MKINTIILISLSLAGCHSSAKQRANINNDPVQFAQSLSSTTKTKNKTKSNRSEQNHNHISDDLWAYMSSNMKLNIPDNSRVQEQRNHFLRSKRHLQEVTSHAEPYIYWIVEQIKQRNMPVELVLIPIIESDFNSHAGASSSTRPAGLWQITPQTGRRYGLKSNQWYDGRHDIVTSTNAVLNMMQRLNRMFHGDWLLTIAAFNSGEGRIMNAIKANRRQGKPTDFWSLSLPPVTRAYVPKILALSDIIKHRKQYGIHFPNTNSQHALTRINIGHQISLDKAAQMAGISLAKMRSYNPEYKRNITTPAGPHYLLLPKANIAKFQSSLNVRPHLALPQQK